MGKVFYLPVEVAARELDSRLLIAHRALQRGFEVIIGQKWLLYDNASFMPQGTFLTKTLTRTDADAMSAAHRAGHFVLALDEEIPGLVAAEQRLRWVSPEAVDQATLIATCGDEHQEAMARKFPRHSAKMVVCGNPRWDLLRPEYRYWYDDEVARLRLRYGGFLLINTNFGLLNAAKGPPEKIIRSLVKSGKIDLGRPEDAAYVEEGRKVQEANMAALDTLLHELPRRFPNHRVVLRPHPSENLDYWQAKLRDVPNVAVVREGSAVPWILASDVLIHTGCTTGVEAFALDKPAISLRSIPSPRERLFLANRINLGASSVEQVLGLTADLLRDGLGNFVYPREFDTVFDRFMAARTGEFATDRLLDALEHRLREDVRASKDSEAWHPLPGYRTHVRRTTNRLQVMPDIDVDELSSRLTQLGGPDATSTGHFVEQCGDRTYIIRSAAKANVEKLAFAPAWKALAHRWIIATRRAGAD